MIFDRTLARTEVRRDVTFESGVGNLVVQVQTIAKSTQLIGIHLLDLVRRVATLDFGSECPALHGLAQNGGGSTTAQILRGGAIGGVQLAIVVSTSGQGAELLVGEMRHHLAQARIRSEEILANEVAVLDRVALELTIDRGVHLVQQNAVLVLGEQVVPLGTPDDLDDVPSRTAEHGLEFLNDLAVAAHRTIEALKVAVHDEDEVVELFSRRQ